MTLSDRIAAATGPDRALDAEIAKVLFEADAKPEWMKGRAPHIANYLSSIDAAISTAPPAMQEHVMREALKLVGQRGFIVGEFAEQLARTICEVSMRERRLYTLQTRFGYGIEFP